MPVNLTISAREQFRNIPLGRRWKGSVLKLGYLHVFQMIKKRHDCNTYNPVTPLLPIIQTPEFEMFSIWVKNKDKDHDQPIQLPIPKNSIRTFFNPLIFFQPSDSSEILAEQTGGLNWVFKKKLYK